MAGGVSLAEAADGAIWNSPTASAAVMLNLSVDFMARSFEISVLCPRAVSRRQRRSKCGQVMRDRLALALGQRSHESWHVEVVGPRSIGKTVHGADQIGVVEPRQPRRRRAALEILSMTRLAHGDALGRRRRGRLCGGDRPILGGEIIRDRTEILEAEGLRDRRHRLVGARTAVIVVQFLIKVIALLPPDDRCGGRRWLAVLAMAAGAYLGAARDVVGSVGGESDDGGDGEENRGEGSREYDAASRRRATAAKPNTGPPRG